MGIRMTTRMTTGMTMITIMATITATSMRTARPVTMSMAMTMTAAMITRTAMSTHMGMPTTMPLRTHMATITTMGKVMIMTTPTVIPNRMNTSTAAEAGARQAAAQSAAQLALLHLASPALPVGAYSYSQGLESAIELGLARDAIEVGHWIADTLAHVVGRYEAPVWLRLHAACSAGDFVAWQTWNADFIATRETAELRAETVQMGYSLTELMRALGHVPPWSAAEVCYPAAQAWASVLWSVDANPGLLAYLFAWVENQVMVALKTVPLGQVAGQKLLFALRPLIAGVAQRAALLDDAALSTQAPQYAIVCARHETQYSRLFRS